MIAGVIIFIIGGIFGVIIMVLLQASKKGDELQDPQEYYDVPEKIDDNFVLEYDIIHVIGNNVCKTLIHNPVYDEPITLGDCEDMLLLVPYPIIVIAENPLDGAIFRFGNHTMDWEQIGTTAGYA